MSFFSPVCSFPDAVSAPVPVDPAGALGPTRTGAGSNWVRTSQRRYVPKGCDRTLPEQRILEQAARLPSHGAVTGWASLRLAGSGYCDGLLWRPGGPPVERPVPLAVGRRGNLRPDLGAEISREPLNPEEVVERHGVPCTRIERSLFDEMRSHAQWEDAVVAFDMAAVACLVSLRRMTAYLRVHTHWRRSSVVTRALPWCSEGSASPSETRIRLLWEVTAGLPRPLVNCDVFDRCGRHLCCADLFDPTAGVVVEYDGSAHRTAARHSRDVQREERCRAAGLEYVKVTGPDLPHREVVVGRMRGARKRAQEIPARRRSWTLEPPPHWRFADTPELILARQDEELGLLG